MVAGTFLVSILAPYSLVLHFASACGLILIGVWLLCRGLRHSRTDEANPTLSSLSCARTYSMVLGLTLLNPVTITYFTTLILGLKVASSGDTLTSLAFVIGAFLASLSWQTFLSGTSGLAHKRFPSSLQSVTFAAGNIMVIALGVAILFRLI